MGYHKVLFGKHWTNSRKEEDGWQFEIVDEKVIWTYSALLDAKTDERSSGYAEFPLEEFKEFFREFLDRGKSSLTNSRLGCSVSLEKKGDKVAIEVRSIGWGDGITDVVNEIPESIMQFL